MGRIDQVDGARMVRALQRLGFRVVRVTGSHHILGKPGHAPVPVPAHKGKTLRPGTARGILKRAGLSEDDFFRAY